MNRKRRVIAGHTSDGIIATGGRVASLIMCGLSWFFCVLLDAG